MRSVYLTARFLAICLSTACLLFTWLLGMRYFSPQTALFALLLLSVAPGAVQQAHFYIVDGVFLAFALAAMYLGARAVERGSLLHYAYTGLLIGGASACRLNGILLGILLVALDAGRNGWQPKRLIRSHHLSAAGTTALATLLILHPYMVSSPLWFQQAISTHDFGLSVQIANGSILQPWTLAYYNTVPYLDTWTQLLPLSMGWPFSLVTPIAIAYAFWKGPWPARAMLLWCGLQFLLVGSLKTQHVRYTVSFLPFIVLFIGHFFISVKEHVVGRLQEIAHALLAVALLLHISVYGVAFASIYSEEDSRLTAARTIARHIPAGSRIGIERGGFSMLPLLDTTRYSTHHLGLSEYFYSSPYMLCSGQIGMLQKSLSNIDYIALIKENRFRQFTAMPSLFPVAADFYIRLLSEELGFESISQLKIEPNLWKLSFIDGNAEPSFLGYDHPTVVLLKKDTEKFHTAVEKWFRSIVVNADCPDKDFLNVSTHFKSGDYQRAAEQAGSLINRLPHTKIAYPIASQSFLHLGEEEKSKSLYDAYRPLNAHSIVSYLKSTNTRKSAPATTAVTYATLGHIDIAVHVLLNLEPEEYSDLPPVDRLTLAENYTYFSLSFLDKHSDQKRDVLEFALQIAPHELAFNNLASLEWETGNRKQAIAHWKDSLQFNPNQATVCRALGEAIAEEYGPHEAAQFYSKQAHLIEAGNHTGETPHTYSDQNAP